MDGETSIEMNLKLIVTKGPEEGKVFYVNEGEAKLVGRGSKNQIHIAGTAISREHCRISNQGGVVTISDLNSKNGTLVNNSLILGEIEVTERDTIKLGLTTFFVRLTEERGPDSVPVGLSDEVEMVLPFSQEPAEEGGIIQLVEQVEEIPPRPRIWSP